MRRGARRWSRGGETRQIPPRTPLTRARELAVPATPWSAGRRVASGVGYNDAVNWGPGDVIVERQVWRGSVVAGFPTIVVANDADCVVTYVAPGAEFGFVDGAYPGPGGRHPWYGRSGWEGHGMLSVVSKTEPVAVQHFWNGPDREFVCWYLNLQEPMRPTEIGFDNQDLELDIVIAAD